MEQVAEKTRHTRRIISRYVIMIAALIVLVVVWLLVSPRTFLWGVAVAASLYMVSVYPLAVIVAILIIVLYYRHKEKKNKVNKS